MCMAIMGAMLQVAGRHEEYAYKKAVYKRNEKFANQAAASTYAQHGIAYQQQRDVAKFHDAKITSGMRKTMAAAVVRGRAAGVSGAVLEAVVSDLETKGLDASGKIAREGKDAKTALSFHGDAAYNKALGRTIAADPGPPPSFFGDMAIILNGYFSSLPGGQSTDTYNDWMNQNTLYNNTSGYGGVLA